MYRYFLGIAFPSPKSPLLHQTSPQTLPLAFTYSENACDVQPHCDCKSDQSYDVEHSAAASPKSRDNLFDSKSLVWDSDRLLFHERLKTVQTIDSKLIV